MQRIEIVINGKKQTVDVAQDSAKTLTTVLRDMGELANRAA